MAASSGGCREILAASSSCSSGGLLLINQMVNSYIKETETWLQSVDRYIQHPYATTSDKLQHLYYITQEVEDRKLNINKIYRNLLITEFSVIHHDLTEDTMVEFRSSVPRNHSREDTMAMKVDRMLEKIKNEVDSCYQEKEFGYMCSNLCLTLATIPPSTSKMKKLAKGSSKMCKV